MWCSGLQKMGVWDRVCARLTAACSKAKGAQSSPLCLSSSLASSRTGRCMSTSKSTAQERRIFMEMASPCGTPGTALCQVGQCWLRWVLLSPRGWGRDKQGCQSTREVAAGRTRGFPSAFMTKDLPFPSILSGNTAGARR